MSFQVVWDMEAYRKLEQLWENVRNIGPIVDAYDEIERRLSDEPEQLGESRPRGRRIWIVPPLDILFRVQPRLKEVHVVDLWKFDDRKS